MTHGRQSENFGPHKQGISPRYCDTEGKVSALAGPGVVEVPKKSPVSRISKINAIDIA